MQSSLPTQDELRALLNQKEKNNYVSRTGGIMNNVVSFASKRATKIEQQSIFSDDDGIIYSANNISIKVANTVPFQSFDVSAFNFNEHTSKLLTILLIEYDRLRHSTKQSDPIIIQITTRYFKDLTGLKGSNAVKQFKRAIATLYNTSIKFTRDKYHNDTYIRLFSAIEPPKDSAGALKVNFIFDRLFCEVLDDATRVHPRLILPKQLTYKKAAYYLITFLLNNKLVNYHRKSKSGQSLEDKVTIANTLKYIPSIKSMDEIRKTTRNYGQPLQALNNAIITLTPEIDAQFEDQYGNRVSTNDIPRDQLDKYYIHVTNWKTIDEQKLRKLKHKKQIKNSKPKKVVKSF